MKIKLVLIFLTLLFLINNVSATTIIYDNITSSQYQTLKISSDLCVKSIIECKHSLYINNNFTQYFANDELLQVPDNTFVNIVLDDPINTNLEESYNNTKRNIMIGTMVFIQPIVTVVIGILLLFMLFRKYGRKERF